MKKFLRIFSSLCLSLSLMSALAQYVEFDIVHFNDVYEIETLSDGTKAGAARVATLIDGVRARYGGEPLIVFSGDAFSPSLLSTVFKGKQMIDAFNALGTDLAVWGNHEFDYGPELAAVRASESNFPWLSSNLLDSRTGQPFAGGERYRIFDWQGVKVGVIGLVNNWLDLSSLGEYAQYHDYVETAQNLVTELEAQGVQYIIALTHMDMADDRVLAARVPQIDLILGGHDHDPIEEVVNNTLIWKTGSDFKTLGDLRVFYFPARDKSVVLANNIFVTDAISEQPAMAALVGNYAQTLDTELGATIGESLVALDAQRASVRGTESNYGNLIADAMRAYAKTDVAIANGGGIRTDSLYEAGTVSKRDIYSVLPFGNIVISVRVSGAELKEAIENGVSQVENGAGRFPQVSGISFSYNPNLEAGSRVTQMNVAGQPLDVNASYTVAINDYMGTGGDGYSTFTNAPRIISEAGGNLLAAVVMDYVAANSPIAPAVEGRITVSQ